MTTNQNILNPSVRRTISGTLHAVADHLPHDAVIHLDIRDGHTRSDLDAAYLGVHLHDEAQAEAIAKAAGITCHHETEHDRMAETVRSCWSTAGVAIYGPPRAPSTAPGGTIQ